MSDHKALTYQHHLGTVEVKVEPYRVREYLRSVPAVDAVANIKACLAALHYNEVERSWEAMKDDPELRKHFETIADLFETYADWFRKVIARGD